MSDTPITPDGRLSLFSILRGQKRVPVATGVRKPSRSGTAGYPRPRIGGPLPGMYRAIRRSPMLTDMIRLPSDGFWPLHESFNSAHDAGALLCVGRALGGAAGRGELLAAGAVGADWLNLRRLG